MKQDASKTRRARLFAASVPLVREQKKCSATRYCAADSLFFINGELDYVQNRPILIFPFGKVRDLDRRTAIFNGLLA